MQDGKGMVLTQNPTSNSSDKSINCIKYPFYLSSEKSCNRKKTRLKANNNFYLFGLCMTEKLD